MPYGKLRIPYVTITFVPYAISCIFFKGMAYGTNKGGILTITLQNQHFSQGLRGFNFVLILIPER